MKLFKFQEEVLEQTKDFHNVAYFLDMGLGKTFVGAQKAIDLGKNILVVCQKSKIKDWYNHFKNTYDVYVHDLTNKDDLKQFLLGSWYMDEGMPDIEDQKLIVGVINYDVIFRRPELSKLKDFTLILDESAIIQNETNKRAKFILKQLTNHNTILLSGTPINGKYEKILSQVQLLDWKIDRDTFEKHYCVKDYIYDRRGKKVISPKGFPVKQIIGYKNVERLKTKLREHGAVFLKTEQVFDLPEQMFYTINVNSTKEYNKFINPKHKMVKVEDTLLVGDTSLTRMLYSRMLCGQYNNEKLEAFEDLITSTEDRIIVFYNFNDELHKLKEISAKHDKPISEVNGSVKNLENYEDFDNSITFIQYQSGSMGLNLQLANKIIYFTPPLSSEHYEQSKKRIHRIGQTKRCLYYNLICKNSIEERIYETLALRRDYTDKLFEEQFK